MDIFDKKNIKAMQLKEESNPFDSKDYIYEIKFDGIRALIYLDKNTFIIKNRKCYDMTNIYPELESLKDAVGNKKCIFDGEIVVFDNGKPSFSKLQERALLKNKDKINYFKENMPVTFICFDILYEDKDLRNLTLKERKKILSKYRDKDNFIKTKQFKKGINLFKEIKKLDLEGIVAKKINSTYYGDLKTDDWIKIKNIKDDEFYIGGYKDDKDSYVASILVGDFIDNKFKFVSKVTLGKNKDEFKIIKKCKRTKNKFDDFNDNNYIYIEPKLICSICFLERTSNGHLRHPVFKALRQDK